jgi:hypothetical protein
MAIVQPSLHLPDDIAARLLTGDLVREGSVVRDRGGRLVKHLREVSRTRDAQDGAFRGAARALTSPKPVAIGLGVVAAAATAGLVTFVLVGNNKQAAGLEMPGCVEKFDTSLRVYLEAARNGCLDTNVLDRLLTDLVPVKAELDTGRMNLDSSARHWHALVDHVAHYTRELAGSNQIQLSELQEVAPHSADNGASRKITELRHYLKIQQHVFRRGA